MRTSARRKLDIALIGGGALVTGVTGLIGGLVSQGEEVTQLWARAELTTDGAADITEVIDYDLGFVAADKHGIFRVVPGLDRSAPIEVSSPDAPDDILVTPEGSGARIRIGNPNITITGQHRYEIRYPLGGVAPSAQLAWDAVGTEWEVPIVRAEVHVISDRRFDDIRCQQGRTGSTAPCAIDQPEPGHLVATATGIDPGEGVTIRATLGDRLGGTAAVRLPSGLEREDETAPGLAFIGGGGMALVAGGVASLLIRRAGREQVWPGGAADAAFGGPAPVAGLPGLEPMRVDITDLHAMTTIEFAPPRELRPGQGGVLLTESVKNEHKVAWLIDAAGAGLVELDGDSTLVHQPTPDGADPEAVSIIEEAFAGRDRLELGSYDPAFASAWGRVGNALEHWRLTGGMWDTAADGRTIRLRVLGFIGGFVGLAGAFATAWWATDGSQAWLLGTLASAAFAGVCMAAVVRGWELRVRTPQGTALWLRVESFRRFLAESEAFHAEEAAKRGVLREYTAWAVATGEIDRWSKAVAGAAIAPAMASGLAWAYVGPSLLHSTSSTSTAPSSSGGGGGGGVGGGAGGGGGGSW